MPRITPAELARFEGLCLQHEAILGRIEQAQAEVAELLAEQQRIGSALAGIEITGTGFPELGQHGLMRCAASGIIAGALRPLQHLDGALGGDRAPGPYRLAETAQAAHESVLRTLRRMVVAA